ncbi:MAG: tetratricopeptide repeat protein [Cytophagales bacterium]
MKDEFFDDMNEALANLKKSREDAMKLLFESKSEPKPSIEIIEKTSDLAISKVGVVPIINKTDKLDNVDIPFVESVAFNSEKTSNDIEMLSGDMHNALSDLKSAKQKAFELLFKDDNQPSNETIEITSTSAVELALPVNESVKTEINIEKSGFEIQEIEEAEKDFSGIKFEEKDFFPKSATTQLCNTFALHFDTKPLVEEYTEMTNENPTQIDRLLDYVNFLEKKFSTDGNNPLDRFILNEPKLKIENFGNSHENNDLSIKSTSFDIDIVTENMAKIYFKQGNKEKAVEIYKRLSLKNPQKMSYFAEKISEIENQ